MAEFDDCAFILIEEGSNNPDFPIAVHVKAPLHFDHECRTTISVGRTRMQPHGDLTNLKRRGRESHLEEKRITRSNISSAENPKATTMDCREGHMIMRSHSPCGGMLLNSSGLAIIHKQSRHHP